jgi:hypothetical protein
MENQIMKLENKDKITSLELVKEINIFREKEGNRAELKHSDFLKVIREEFEEEIGLGKISQSTYKNSQNKEQPMFVLTFNQAKQLLVRESRYVRKAIIEYIEILENEIINLQNQISFKDRLLINIINSNGELELATNLNKYEMQYVKPLEINLKDTQNKLEHKQNVINGISNEIKLKSQRQFLNEIIRMKGVDKIRDRWNVLYREYENHKHINLKARIESYNIVNKPKIKSKLQHIDEKLNDITTLYKIAVKLFESDFKDNLKKYLEVL